MGKGIYNAEAVVVLRVAHIFGINGLAAEQTGRGQYSAVPIASGLNRARRAKASSTRLRCNVLYWKAEQYRIDKSS